MGGRGSSSGISRDAKTFDEVIHSSSRSVVIAGSVYFDDGVHVPTTHRQKELQRLLNRPGMDDFVLQTNNDKRGRKIVKQIEKMGFNVKKQYKQKSDTPYLRNYYYMKKARR